VRLLKLVSRSESKQHNGSYIRQEPVRGELMTLKRVINISGITITKIERRFSKNGESSGKQRTFPEFSNSRVLEFPKMDVWKIEKV